MKKVFLRCIGGFFMLFTMQIPAMAHGKIFGKVKPTSQKILLLLRQKI